MLLKKFLDFLLIAIYNIIIEITKRSMESRLLYNIRHRISGGLETTHSSSWEPLLDVFVAVPQNGGSSIRITSGRVFFIAGLPGTRSCWVLIPLIVSIPAQEP